MSSPHQQHVAAIGFASLSIREASHSLTAADEAFGRALGRVVNATGSHPRNTDAQTALNMTVELIRSLAELRARCDTIIDHLNAYTEGSM